MDPLKRASYAIAVVFWVMAASAGTTAAQICGDIDLSGGVDIIDLSLLNDYLYGGGALPDPAAADNDGVPGITQNDAINFAITTGIFELSLDCSVVPDSTFPQSADTVKLRGTRVPSMLVGPHVVEVWLKGESPYYGALLAMSYSFTGSPMILDSIVPGLTEQEDINTVDQKFRLGMQATTEYPAEETLLASLYFTISSPLLESQEIVFSLTDYPPSHTSVISRTGTADRAVDGFEPVLVVDTGGSECLADGDVNGNGSLEITDVSALTNFVYLGGTAPDPLYRADVTGDCVIDSLDIIGIACAIFGCDNPPALPVATCCYPRVFAPGDTALAIGEALLATNGDTILVNMFRDDGSDGIRIYGNQSRSRGISVDLINADLSQPNAGLSFEISGYVESAEKMQGGGLQAMASVGIWNNGSGSLQVYGDFSPVGDPNVLVEVYYSGVGLTGSASVPGGGLIAFGNEYNGGGLPSVTNAAFQTAAPPTFSARLSVPTEFTLVGGPTLVGDSIRLVGVNARTITHCSTFDLNGLHITFLGLVNIKTNACCRGFTGNADCDYVDVVDVTDIQVLIDNLFLTLTPLCCEMEANYNYPGSGYSPPDNIIDITDLSILIDNQFLTLTPLPACP